MTDYTCTTIPAEYAPGAHHDAEYALPVHHDAVYAESVHHDAVTHVVTTPGVWANWSPDDTQGPQDYTPVWPLDDRGTWHVHTGPGGPDGDQTGTWNQSSNGNGKSSWFHREAGTATTVVDTPAYDDAPVLITGAYDDAPVLIREAYDDADVLVKPADEVCVDVTPTVLCHDGDTWTLPAWEAVEHFALGDVAGECGPEWHPTPEVPAPAPSDPASIVIEAAPPAEVTAIVIEPVAETVAVTSSAPAAPMLAETGAEPVVGLMLAGALVVAGIVSLITRRVLR